MIRMFIIFLCFWPLLSIAQLGRHANDISFYWGTTYRLDHNFYQSFDLSYEHFQSSCTQASFNGFGLRYDNFNNTNYAISARYFRDIVNRPDLLMSPYLGISPVVFSMSRHVGLNLKPEIGLRLNSAAFTLRQPVSLSLNFSYGYDIPLIEKKAFVPGRHDLSVKAALSFNIHEISHSLNRRKNKNDKPIEEQKE